MEHPEGADKTGDIRLGFDRRVRLEFHGSKISSHGGLLLFRELDEVLSLHAIAGGFFRDTRTGHNRLHTVVRDLARPRGLIGAQNAENMGSTVFHLGNAVKETSCHSPLKTFHHGNQFEIKIAFARWRHLQCWIGEYGDDPH